MNPAEILTAVCMVSIAGPIIIGVLVAVDREEKRLEAHAKKWNLDSFGVEDGTIGMTPISRSDNDVRLQ